MRSLIITYGFTEFRKSGHGLVAKDSYCHAEQLTNQPFKSIVPDEFTRNIVPPEIKVKIIKRDGKLGLFRPKTPTPIGLDLDDWVNETFPTDQNDPRFNDDDDDGKPGVTVKMRIFGIFPAEIYIARREIFSYKVFPNSKNEFIGQVKDLSEQIVIGSKPRFLDFPPTPVLQDEDLNKSPIILIPVDEDYDCELLMKNRRKLFPKNPKP